MRRCGLCVLFGLIACVPQRAPTPPDATAPTLETPAVLSPSHPARSNAASAAPPAPGAPTAPPASSAVPLFESAPARNDSAARLPAFEIEPPYAPESPPALPAGSVAASVAAEELGRWNVGGSSAPEHPSNRSGFHPAVRVVVNTVALRRLPKQSSSRAVLTQSRLQAAARNTGYWPFRHCFEEILERAPAHRGGETRMRISIAQSGAVTAARSLRSELRDTAAARCLVQAARRLRFRPGPTRRLDVDLSVELWPGDVPVYGTRRSAAQPEFDARVVRRVVESAADRLARCYVAALERDPRLWGRLAVRFGIAENGTVSSAREQESRFPDPEVTRCVVRTIEQEGPKLWVGPFEFVLALRCGTLPSGESVPPSEEGPLRHHETRSGPHHELPSPAAR